MPAGGELSVFKKPSKILHSIRRSLDTLEKSEEVFTQNLPSSLIQLFLSIWWNLMSSLLFSTSVCEVVKPGSFTLLILWFLFLTKKTSGSATRGSVLKIRYYIQYFTMNSSYIGWKFVDFMKDHNLFFPHLY